MAADRAHSPAYLAMKPSGRRCLALIESALTHRGGDTAALSHGQFKAWGVARCSSCYAVKALVALGFVTVASGKRRANVFRLCEDWRALDASEAARLEQSAREAKPQAASRKVVPKPPKPKPVARPRVIRRRTPSLPALRCLQGEVG